MNEQDWARVSETLIPAVGDNNYKSWIAPLCFDGIEDGVARFVAPTTFHGSFVQKEFADRILSQLQRHGAEAQRVAFTAGQPRRAAPRPSAPAPAAPAPAEAAAPAVADESGLSTALDARFTFDRFVVGKPNEMAHAAAKRVAEGGPSGFNPLFLYGGVGLGKTHLMHAIAHELKARDPEVKIVITSAEQFMYRFITALRDKRMMDFKLLYRSVDVLMVDDVQFLAGKDSTQEEFFHTFNALIEGGKQIIISADRAPGAMKDVEQRITSRLASGLVVDLYPTDYELRVGILQSKADLYRQQYPGLTIAPGVLEFLAHRISSNVRVLEGALTRLFAFASLVGREITMEMTQDCLSDILRSSDSKISIEVIQRKVSDHFNIRLSDLVGPKRLRSIARPRQIAMYLAKSMTSRSLPEIGRRFGGRDHTTVLHGVRKIEELKQTDAQIADDLELLRRALEE
ncbi:chromosomal replication initiator protein DnaA [Pseudoroseicyclus aestuarii]|nr:chromosomal replication initiator protein DnaA [Pseudoroseicyclus aestuarii]